jgi:hypothetical protein
MKEKLEPMKEKFESMKERIDPELKRPVLMKHSTEYIMGAEIVAIGEKLGIDLPILRRILVESRAAHPDDVKANVERATNRIMRAYKEPGS